MKTVSFALLFVAMALVAVLATVGWLRSEGRVSRLEAQLETKCEGYHLAVKLADMEGHLAQNCLDVCQQITQQCERREKLLLDALDRNREHVEFLKKSRKRRR